MNQEQYVSTNNMVQMQGTNTPQAMNNMAPLPSTMGMGNNYQQQYQPPTSPTIVAPSQMGVPQNMNVSSNNDYLGVVPPQPTVTPDVVVTSSIPEIVPETMSLNQLAKEQSSDSQVVVPPVINEGVAKEPMPESKDGFTFDYNAIYNTGVQPEVSVVNESVQPEIIPTNVVSDSNSQDSLATLQMAAPPSFETAPTPKEPEPQQPEQPLIEPVNKADLVSINIEEPDSLPVGNAVKKSMDVNPLQNETFQPPTFQPPTFEQPVQATNNYPNNNVMPNNYNRNTAMNNNTFTSYAVPPMNNQFGGPSFSQGNMQQPQTMAPNNMPTFQTSGQPLLREVEDNRAQMNVAKGPIGAKFIANEENKYTLPKTDPEPVNMPTDPNLIANPMSIFGASAGVLRPTSGEAIREPSPQPNQIPVQPMQQPRPRVPQATVCPNCGFIVKPGQPSCVVCGYRFE